MEMIWEVLHHALEDSVKMLPFLFAAYLLIEFLEHRHSETVERVLAGGGRFGFLPGAVLGLVPQCGFSAMAANLYGSKVITLGTLIAVFIATSDEAVPILAAMPGQWGALAKLLAAKLLAAVAAGFLLDVVLKKAVPQNLRGGFSGHAGEVDCHDTRQNNRFLWRRCATRCIFLCIFFCSTWCWAPWCMRWAPMPLAALWPAPGFGSLCWRAWWALCPTARPAFC